MSFKRICALVIIVPLAVILIAFILVNRGSAPVNFNLIGIITGSDSYNFTAPMFIWIFLFLLIGLLLGGLAMLPKLYGLQKKLSAAARENARLKAELIAKPAAGAETDSGN